MQLLRTTSVLPHSAARAEVRILQDGPYPSQLLVGGDRSLKSTLAVDLVDALLEPSEDGMASVLLTSASGFTCRVKAGSTIGTAAEVSILESAAPAGDTTASVYRVPSSGEVPPASGEKARKEKLLEAIVLPELPEAEKEQLQGFLEKHHLAFCLEPGERGETDLVQFQIDTADSSPQRQPARRLPFAVR